MRNLKWMFLSLALAAYGCTESDDETTPASTDEQASVLTSDGPSDADADANEEGAAMTGARVAENICDGFDDGYEAQFTEVQRRADSDPLCPQLTPESFVDDEEDEEGDEDEDDEDDDCTLADGADDPSAVCVAVLTCNETNEEGNALSYVATLAINEDLTFTGTLEVQTAGLSCAYDIGGRAVSTP